MINMKKINNEYQNMFMSICLVVVGFGLCAAATIIQIHLLQQSGLLWNKLFIKHWSLSFYSGIIPMFIGFILAAIKK